MWAELGMVEKSRRRKNRGNDKVCSMGTNIYERNKNGISWDKLVENDKRRRKIEGMIKSVQWVEILTKETKNRIKRK